MRKGAIVLTVLAAVCFLLASLHSVIGYWFLRGPFVGLAPQTHFRGAVGLLLFAVVFLLLERTSSRG
jgi:hypothetical protein